MKKLSPGAALAAARWKDATEKDREQPRQAGMLGGRPATCACGTCQKCRRRFARQQAAA